LARRRRSLGRAAGAPTTGMALYSRSPWRASIFDEAVVALEVGAKGIDSLARIPAIAVPTNPKLLAKGWMNTKQVVLAIGETAGCRVFELANEILVCFFLDNSKCTNLLEHPKCILIVRYYTFSMVSQLDLKICHRKDSVEMGKKIVAHLSGFTMDLCVAADDTIADRFRRSPNAHMEVFLGDREWLFFLLGNVELTTVRESQSNHFVQNGDEMPG